MGGRFIPLLCGLGVQKELYKSQKCKNWAIRKHQQFACPINPKLRGSAQVRAGEQHARDI